MDVLLTDGNERAALAAARSLVHAGFEVGVAAGRRLSLAGVSRGVRRLRLSTDPLADAAAYAAEVGELARQLDVRVLLPITDASVEAVLADRRHIPTSVALPFPDLGTYRKASDKAAMLDCARQAGLGVPETVSLGDANARLPGADFFPAVLKPHRSVVSAAPAREAGRANGENGRRHLAVRFVDTPDKCRAVLGTFPGTAFPVLLQRRVRGPGEGLFVLRWDGRVVAEFAHRRLREKPPEGGVSVYRESITLDTALAEAGRRLLGALDWQGVAMIECKRDEETGRHVLMEVNGRLWGSLQLAIDAGVDFPRLLVACALGQSVPAVTHYRVGVRSRWFWGDVDHLYLRLRNAGGAAGRLTAVRDFLRVELGRNREEIWRWRDPAPFLIESLQQLGLAR
jgi:predicted ATP-grasp superfamily ATP-dependent carboligase